jgi:plastocyanin
MYRRDLVSLSALALTALTLGIGCPEENSKPTGGTATPAKSAASTPAAPVASATPAPPTQAAAPAAVGKGTIKGVVNFTGKPVEMKVPAKRKDADFCKGKEVKYNAVLVKDGKLQDTFVRIEVGGVKGTWKAPEKHAEIDQVDCMYSPRIQGVVSEQEVDIKNGDGTLHNVHTYKGAESLFNQAQPKGSDPLTKSWEDGIIKFTCDVHPWMRGFVIVTDHPFFAVSGADGTFTIDKVPAGKYNLEAWHTVYGLKKAQVEVSDDKPAEITFSYDGTEAEPAENKDELKGLW